ncbi:hypothetical protein R1sor_005093 [Riccia sorocarpa]|uniref:Uncharacterized protein n=1 Tax=Riccia sorocarpa TaxID=122646 RepID=A0ABD3HIU2_9MARC
MLFSMSSILTQAQLPTTKPSHNPSVGSKYAGAEGHDIHHIFDLRFNSIREKLGSSSEEWKSKFDFLQKSKAEEEAKHKALLKANIVKNMQLTPDLVSAKTEGDTLRAKVADLQSHIHMLNDRCNKTKRTAADQASSLKDANRTQELTANLQDELSRLKKTTR